MSDAKAPVTRPATAESIVNYDQAVGIGLALGLFIIFVVTVGYHAEKTNERLLRLEKIVQMDEIGRRK